MVVSRVCRVLVMAAVLAATPVLWASPINVGSGNSTAHVVINWKDGATYQFDVAFTGPTTTGIDLVKTIDTALGDFTAVISDFGFGEFVDGLTYQGHSNVGFGGGEDWWHYWLRDDAGSPWVSPIFGASDRVVENGNWDGWVYGNAAEPISAVLPEPAAALVLLSGGAALVARRPRGRQVG